MKLRPTLNLLSVRSHSNVGEGQKRRRKSKSERGVEGGEEEEVEEGGQKGLASSQKHERLSLWILPLSQTCIRQARPPCPRTK